MANSRSFIFSTVFPCVMTNSPKLHPSKLNPSLACGCIRSIRYMHNGSTLEVLTNKKKIQMMCLMTYAASKYEEKQLLTSFMSVNAFPCISHATKVPHLHQKNLTHAKFELPKGCLQIEMKEQSNLHQVSNFHCIQVREPIEGYPN